MISKGSDRKEFGKRMRENCATKEDLKAKALVEIAWQLDRIAGALENDKRRG